MAVGNGRRYGVTFWPSVRGYFLNGRRYGVTFLAVGTGLLSKQQSQRYGRRYGVTF